MFIFDTVFFVIMLLLSIKSTETTPQVVFDIEKNIFEISGSSRPENISAFYTPIINTIETHFQSILQKNLTEFPPQFTFNFRLYYFNSGTSHFIASLFQLLNSYTQYGIASQIHWYYDDEDMDMYEAGEELSFLTTIPFHFIAE
jgi:hypothetical protein